MRAMEGESGGVPIRWVHVLFFFSGFPALLYQIVWQRALFTLYGVNIESVTIVVSAFMLGQPLPHNLFNFHLGCNIEPE